MVRSTVLAVLVSLVLAPGSRTSAQDAAMRCAPPPSEVIDPAEELASIDAESHAATGLYVTMSVLLATAGALAAAGYAANPLCISFSGGCGGDPEAATALTISSGAMAGLAVLALGVAIGLDVDSGARRGAWQGRNATARVGLSGLPGGAALTVGGTF